MPVTVPLLASLVCVVYGSMIVEAVRAARHERRQLERGGIEPDGDVYRVMRLAYPLTFGAMLVEALVRGWPSAASMLAGAAIFLAAKGLKWWAIVTLGPAWTFRVIVVPGAPLVGRGPYRFLRHPNYVGVVGELVGVALMTGAALTGPLALFGFGLLLWKRIAIEQRALTTSGPPAARGV